MCGLGCMCLPDYLLKMGFSNSTLAGIIIVKFDGEHDDCPTLLEHLVCALIELLR